jgi:glutamyl-tRNA synthetase
MCLGFLQKANLVSDPVECEQGDLISRIVEAAGDRICMAGDILKFDTFFIADQNMEFDDKPFQKRMVKPANAGFLLAEFNKILNATDDFEAAALETTLHGFCETQGIVVGDVIHALRVAVTGKAAGFGMFDTMAILGRERTCNRIQIALDELAKRVEANQ